MIQFFAKRNCYLLAAILVSTNQVSAEEFTDLNTEIMCELETRQFEDARKAYDLDGDPDTFTESEQEFRDQLMDKLKADFNDRTGMEFDSMSGKWLNHIIKNGNPC